MERRDWQRLQTEQVQWTLFDKENSELVVEFDKKLVKVTRGLKLMELGSLHYFEEET